MRTSDSFAALVDLIYDGCLDSTVWPKFLGKCTARFNSIGAVLLVHEPGGNQAQISFNAGLDRASERAYNEYYHDKDVWLRRAPELLGFDNIYTTEMACPRDELVRTEYYCDYLQPIGVLHGMYGRLAGTGGTACAIATSRSPSAGPFGEGDVALFRALLPHVSQALAVQTRVASLEAEKRALMDTLDQLSAGCILLDARGRVLMMNRAAKSIMDANDGISIEREALALGTSAQCRELNLLIAGALARASRASISARVSMLVERPSLRRPYSLLLSPLGKNASSILHSPAAIMIVITDPVPPSQLDSLYAMYKLTGGEKRLASILIDGSNLTQAAALLGVTVNTAKTHLSRIFAKTGVRRQSELVRLFSTAATAQMSNTSPDGDQR